MKEITPSIESAKLFEKLFMIEWQQAEKDIDMINKEKKKRISLIEEEMKRIDKTIDYIVIPALHTKKQQERADFNQEKEDLEYEIDHIRFTQSEFEKTYNEAKLVITNPLALWDLEDIEIKQLLLRVCFNNQIYYSKKE